jgi:hypothetical protein
MALKQVIWRGRRFNERTVAMLQEMERLLGFKLVYTQGSYNKSVAASGGTHDGGGAVDISVKDQRTGELFPMIRRQRIRDAGRQVGFAMWIRDPSQSPDFPWHVHGIAIDDEELSPGAAAQVVQYHKGTNGLVSHGKDDGPRTWVNMTWEKYLKAHPPVVEKPPAATEEDPFMAITKADLVDAFKQALAAERPAEDSRLNFDNDHDEQVLCWQVGAQAVANLRAAELRQQGMPDAEIIAKIKDETWPALRALWA